MLHSIKEIMRDNRWVMRFHKDLFVHIMRFYLDTINDLGLSQNNVTDVFLICQQLRNCFTAPSGFTRGGGDALTGQCVRNFSETITVHEVMKDKKHCTGLSGVNHKLSGTRDLVAIADGRSLGGGSALKALLEPSTNLLTFCQFRGNIFLPKFQVQDSRRHSPEGLCQIS